MKSTLEAERETDGHWIADALELPGCMTYGKSKTETLARMKTLALHGLTNPRGGWTIKRQEGKGGIARWILTLLKQKTRSNFVFERGEEFGPKMLLRTAKRTGLEPKDL
jgi:hypothetical protein